MNVRTGSSRSRRRTAPFAPKRICGISYAGVPEWGINGAYKNFMPRLGFAYDVTGDGKTRSHKGPFVGTASARPLDVKRRRCGQCQAACRRSRRDADLPGAEGYYVASVPQIPACHTQARSLDEVTERIREAIELCLEVEGTPEQDLEFVGIQRVTIAA
jgi:predicted RNase H-like HicB family nuclease